MGGLGALIVVAIYLAIAVAVVRAIKIKSVRYAAIAFFVLAPTTDAIVGRIYLKHLCATEGGLKVLRVVEDVEGLSWGNLSPTGEWVKRFRYLFEEGHVYPNGNVDRISRRGNELVVETNVVRKSEYVSRFREERGAPMIVKSEAIVEVINTGEVLASWRAFYFRGGWAERLLGGFSDAGPAMVSCRENSPPHIMEEQAVLSALKPKS